MVRPPGQLDLRAAAALRYARRQRPPVKRFAYELRSTLGWSSLSRQTIYVWERGQVRVPGAVLLAAARVTGLTIEELVMRSRRDDACPD